MNCKHCGDQIIEAETIKELIKNFEKDYGDCLTDCQNNPDHGALIGDAGILLTSILNLLEANEE